MKRVIGISVFTFLILALVASVTSAYVELEVYKDRCYADGSISVTVVNGKNDPFAVNETTLLVQNAYERNKTFTPEGYWTQPVTYYNFTTGKAQESMFIGNEDLITEEGDYHLFINYNGCRQGRCTAGATIKNCLAHKMDCYKYKPLGYDCSVDHGERMAYIRFGGEKNKFFTEVDPARDLIYFITSDLRDLHGVRRLEGAEFSKLGDIREMRFPLLKDETISDVAIVHNRCDSPFQQQKRVVCSVVDRAGRRGINNALKGEQTGVVAPLPARSPLPAQPTAQSAEVNAQQELVEKIIQQKEQETAQRVAQAQQELEKTRAELDAYKQFVQQAEPEQPTQVPKVTGGVVGTTQGIPTPYLTLLIIVGIGVVIVIVTTIYAKKKREQNEERKKEEERKEKRFGFGD